MYVVNQIENLYLHHSQNILTTTHAKDGGSQGERVECSYMTEMMSYGCRFSHRISTASRNGFLLLRYCNMLLHLYFHSLNITGRRDMKVWGKMENTCVCLCVCVEAHKILLQRQCKCENKIHSHNSPS